MNGKYYQYYFAVFFTWATTYSLITVYFNEGLGISANIVGTFMSFVPLITMTFQPIWGAISDNSGNRRKILSGLIAMTTLIAIAMPFLKVPWLGLVGYGIFMLFLSGQNPISDSMTINYVNLENNGASYGNIRSWGSIGYAVGAFVAAKLSAAIGLNAIFYIAAIGYPLSFLLLRRLNTYATKPQKRNYFLDLKALLQNKQYVFVLAYTFFLIGSFFAGEQFIFMYTRSKGIPISGLGTITAVSVFFEIPFIFYSKRLIRIFGERRLIAVITLASALRMLILSISSQFIIFMIAGAVRGAVVGIFIPLFVEMISEITPREVVSSAISIYTAVSNGIGTFIFTMSGSLLLPMIGYEHLYRVYGVITIGAILMLRHLPAHRVNDI